MGVTKYNPRAELLNIIDHFERTYAKMERDPAVETPKLSNLQKLGVTKACRATIDNWRNDHTDLSLKIQELIEKGPNAGKAQHRPGGPGVSAEKRKELETAKEHREHALKELSEPVVEKLKEFARGADINEEWHVRELNKTLGNLSKGWDKEISGGLKLDHKHDHVHRLADELANMTPEERAQLDQEAIRDIGSNEEAERRVRALKPASQPVTVEVLDAVCVD